MKKPLVALITVLGLVIVSYFTYDLLKGVVSPCETIFQQSTLQIQTKIKLVKIEGETIIGKQKIQDLTESAQITAERLKACCIVLHEGYLDADQFLQCKDEGRKYQEQLDVALAQVKSAKDAQQAGQTDVYQEKIRQLNLTIENAKADPDLQLCYLQEGCG